MSNPIRLRRQGRCSRGRLHGAQGRLQVFASALPQTPLFGQLAVHCWCSELPLTKGDMPCRHIDCAAAYGNQEDVGKGLKRAFDEGICKREDVWITSKLWNSDHGNVKGAIEKTLKVCRLSTHAWCQT